MNYEVAEPLPSKVTSRQRHRSGSLRGGCLRGLAMTSKLLNFFSSPAIIYLETAVSPFLHLQRLALVATTQLLAGVDHLIVC